MRTPFFLAHLPLMLAIGALASVPAVRPERRGHRGLVVATAGLGRLALMEIAAMSAAASTNGSTLGTTQSSLYGAVLTIGVGLLVVFLRRQTVGLRIVWALLTLRAFVFVGLGPPLATDSFVAGRLTVVTWMLLFGLLGWMMQRPGVCRWPDPEEVG